MIKIDIINSSLLPLETKSGLVYSGQLKLAHHKKYIYTSKEDSENKTVVMTLALNEEQLSEIISKSGPQPNNVHLILCDSCNKNESELSSGENTQNKYNLTKSEIKILESLSLGLTYDEIARKHFISSNTVKCHISNIFRKLDVHKNISATKLLPSLRR